MQPKLTPTTNDAVHTNGVLNAIMPPVVKSFLEQNEIKAPAPSAQELKVAIIGTAPSSRLLAPFNDPSWKIWVCSPGNQNAIPRVDAWFEIHGNMLYPQNRHYGEPYLKWLSEQKFPVYMQDKSFLPQAIPLPVEELIDEVEGCRDFFTSSFAWMIAMAFKQGAKEIALYGIDMASREEYILQRPGFYFFRHMAKKRGIKVWAPHESDIMQSPMLYGFSEVTPIGRKIGAREDELKQRLNELTAQRDKMVSDLNHQIVYLQGALEDVDYFKNIFGGAQSHPVERSWDSKG